MTDVPVAVLLVLAVASVGVYGIILAGWSSGSTYPLLGGLRSTAQVISYEIAMGLSLVAIFLYSGSMSTSAIVSAQSSLWYILPAFFSFAVYVVTMVGETNRLPFDLAEGEGELTGGFHTEYSSMRFAMFFLGEYVNMFTVSALATTLFLGGWQAPPFISAINDNMFGGGWWGLLWFTAKLWMFMFVFVWLRGSLPRVRYDQFMRFGWKFLIPITLAWVVAVAFIRGAQLGFLGDSKLTFAGRELSVATVVIVSIVAVIALAAAWIWDDRRAARAAAADETPPEEIDPFEDGYPVPPLPGQRLVEPTRGPPAGGDPRARADDRRHLEHLDRRQGGGPWLTTPSARTCRPGAPRRGSEVGAPRDQRSGQDDREKGFLSELFAPVAGFGVSFSTMFRKVATEEYPEKPRPTAPRFHGRHQLNRHPDGLEKCVGCELCAWACPADAILVEGADNDDTRSTRVARAGSAPASATAASTRSTTCAASSAASASRRARPAP